MTCPHWATLAQLALTAALALPLLAVTVDSTAPAVVGVYDGPGNAGIYMGACGFEVRGTFGPYCTPDR